MNSEEDYELFDNKSEEYISCVFKLNELLNEKIRERYSIKTINRKSLGRIWQLDKQIRLEEQILKDLSSIISDMEYFSLVDRERARGNL